MPNPGGFAPIMFSPWVVCPEYSFALSGFALGVFALDIYHIYYLVYRFFIICNKVMWSSIYFVYLLCKGIELYDYLFSTMLSITNVYLFILGWHHHANAKAGHRSCSFYRLCPLLLQKVQLVAPSTCPATKCDGLSADCDWCDFCVLNRMWCVLLHGWCWLLLPSFISFRKLNKINILINLPVNN